MRSMPAAASNLNPALALAAAVWLAPVSPAAAGLPEPDTILYGKVFHRNHIYELVVTEGELEWIIRLDDEGTRTLTLRTELEPLADGAFSYRLKVPHEAFVAGFSAANLSPDTVPLGTDDIRYRHHEIRINGTPARILPPGREFFDASQTRRLSTHRLDLAAVLEIPDSDGDGIPDWWETKFGLDRFAADGTGDLDGDGLDNRTEFRLGSDPTLPDNAPRIAWENTALGEGATEIVTFQVVDADTPPDQLVYTLLEAPVGAEFHLLFGATSPGPDGTFGDRPLRAGDTFTQTQVNAGELALRHQNPEATQIDFRLRLSDGDPGHPPFETTLTVHVHRPSADDGTGAAIWYDAPFEALQSGAATVTRMTDRSGPKPWLDGVSRPFDARAGEAPIDLTNGGPLGQPVLAFNLPGTPLPPAPDGLPAGQFLAPPAADQARVFAEGERTVFAIVKTMADGTHRGQIVSGAHFEVAFTGAENHGRDNQIRFATDNVGTVYGNHEIRDRWTLVTAWEEAGFMTVQLDSAWAGGPHAQRETTDLGSGPLLGGKQHVSFDPEAGRQRMTVEEPFEGMLGEVLVFNRALEDAERERINFQLLSKWFGWVLLDGSEEYRDLDWRVASSPLTLEAYRSEFVPRHGPDRHYILLGGAGHDVLQGGHNDDILVGEAGIDHLTGHGGRDRFVFNHTDNDHGQDVITDFRPHQDHDAIDLTDLLRGDSRTLRDYLRLRTDGQHSYLDIDFQGEGRYEDHTVVLQHIVLRDEDLYDLWARTNLITGDKRFALPVTIATTAPVATEITGEPAVFNLHFGGESVPDGLEIPFELGGTAIRDVDYRLSVRTYHAETGVYSWEPVVGHELFVQEKVGDLDFAIRVEPLPDGRAEGTETVVLHLTPVPEMFDLVTAEAGVTIIDGLPRVGVVASDPAASEAGDAGAFTLTRAGSLDIPFDVAVQLTGPARNGVDYHYIPSVVHFAAGQPQAVVAVQPIPDDERELPEPVELVIQPGNGHQVDPAGQAATVVIADAGPVITVETVEPLAVVQDSRPGAFLVRRQGMVNETLTVRLGFTGSATMNVDYEHSSPFVTFAPGNTTVVVSIQPRPGASLPDGVETVDLSVLQDVSYTLGAMATARVRLVGATRTFAQWKDIHFPGEPTPAALFATLDFDGDRLSNGTEYAFGFDPTVADPRPAGSPVAVRQAGRFGVRFARPVAVVDVVYDLEVSPDLKTWTPAGDRFETLSGELRAGGLEEITCLEREPAPNGAWLFVRVLPRLP
ncbi:MAG: type I secretion C-terminal target domain-containing protein [Verrucomicrobiales bacterium]|nr:type I secretion C-terminal target domain-containing protein [Verrucomicrobiales bacterium]